MEPDYLRVERLSSGNMWILNAFNVLRKVSAGESEGGGIWSCGPHSSVEFRSNRLSIRAGPGLNHWHFFAGSWCMDGRETAMLVCDERTLSHLSAQPQARKAGEIWLRCGRA